MDGVLFETRGYNSYYCILTHVVLFYGILNLRLPLDSYPNHKITWVNKEWSKVHLPALSIRSPGALCALSWPPAVATLIITVLHETTITILPLLHDTVSTIRCLCLHKTLRLNDILCKLNNDQMWILISIIYLPLLSVFCVRTFVRLIFLSDYVKIDQPVYSSLFVQFAF